MPNRLLLTLAVVLFVTAHIAVGAEEERTKKPLNARQTAAAFLDAALSGRLAEAASLGEPGRAYNTEKGCAQFAELKVKQLAIESAYADEANALVITANVTGDRGRQGPLVLTLVKKDDAWLIRDVDLEDEESVEDEVERFLKDHPKAKLLPAEEKPK